MRALIRILDTAFWWALAVAVVLWIVPKAGAHGEYAWINDGNYKAADGSHCCGWNDCIEIDPAQISERGDGFHYQTRIIDKRAVYQSRDGKAWLCRGNKCLFIPGGG